MDKHPMTASTEQVRLPNVQHAVPLAWAPGPATLGIGTMSPSVGAIRPRKAG